MIRKAATAALFASVSVMALSPVSVTAQETPSDTQGQTTQDTPPAEGDENTIVVTGIRASLQNAAREKENADQVKDVISAEDIGKLPDTNVAEALQRVTGVQINRDQGEGSEISVRGFSQNRVEVNGQTQVGSNAEGDVAFNTIPSEAFKSIEVIKTPAADEIEGALGAIVRFNTRQPLDRGGRLVLSANAQAQYAERADEWTPNYSFLASKGWTFGDGAEFGALLSYTHKSRKLRQDFFDVRGWDAVDGFGLDLDGDGTAGEPIERDENFIITDLQDGAFVPLQTRIRVTEQDRKLDSWTGALQLKTSPVFELYLNGSYSRRRRDDLQYQANSNFARAVSSRPGGNTISDEYSDLENIVISPDQTVLAAFLGSFDNRGRPNGIPFNVSAASNPPQQDIWTLQGGAIFEMSDRLSGEIQVSIGRGKTRRQFINTNSGIGGRDRPFHYFDFSTGADIPTFIPLALELNGEPVTSYDPAAAYDFTDISLYGFNNLVVRQEKERSVENAIRFDFDYELDSGFLRSVEFGARFAEFEGRRSRQEGGDRPGDEDGTLGGRDFEDLIEDEPGLIVGLPFDDVLDGASGDYLNFYFIPDPLFVVDNLDRLFSEYGITYIDDPQWGFDARRFDQAAYLKGNFEFNLGSMPVFGNAGVRYVHTSRRATGTVLDGVQDDLSLTEQTFDFEYDEWLPSMNLAAEVGDRFYVRVGAARALSRPRLVDIAPVRNVSDSFDTGRAGNPTLEPAIVNQFDVSVEKYWGDSNYASAAFFLKDYSQRIEDGIGRLCLPIEDGGLEQTPGDDGCPVGQDFTALEQPVNVGGATVKGFEVAIQQSFDFLPSPLDGFGAIANYTYVDASGGGISLTGNQLPVQDLSKHSYNLIGYYEKYGLSARAAYSWRSEFYDELSTTGFPSFAKPYGQLDASVSYDVTKKISVSFEALNLLNEPEIRYQEIEERLLFYGLNDRRFLVGVRIRN